MEKTPDWHSARIRDAQWKLFHPTAASLNTYIVMGLLAIPLLFMLFSPSFKQGTLPNIWVLISAAQVLLIGIFVGYNPFIMKRDKLPSVAISHKFLAIKRALMPGYLLIRWEEIKAVSLAENKTQIKVKTQSMKPDHAISTYLPLSASDIEKVLQEAKMRMPAQPASSTTDSISPNPSHGLPMPSASKPRARPFFKKLLFAVLGIIGLMIALLIYYVVDHISSMPTHEELMGGNQFPPYETYMRNYPDSLAGARYETLNYAFIYNGLLIEQNCRLLSKNQAKRLGVNAQASERIFMRHLEDRLSISPQKATNRITFLHNAISEQLDRNDCGEKAEKIAYYAHDQSRKWVSEYKALPYKLRD